MLQLKTFSLASWEGKTVKILLAEAKSDSNCSYFATTTKQTFYYTLYHNSEKNENVLFQRTNDACKKTDLYIMKSILKLYAWNLSVSNLPLPPTI